MDNNRELRSMIFCTIHLPPLPAVVARIDRDDNTVIDDDAVESSHSIIGSMMEWSAMANNEKANTARLMAQTKHFENFKEEMLNMDLNSCTPEVLYDFYGRHTRQWLDTYSKVGNTLCFKPLHYVVNNDKTHQNMQGYTKAQHCLFTGQRDALSLSNSASYADLMRKCAQWTKESLMCTEDINCDNSNITDNTASYTNASDVVNVFNNDKNDNNVENCAKACTDAKTVDADSFCAKTEPEETLKVAPSLPETPHHLPAEDA